ncbi:MAG: flavodoxin family protein [Mogibacterium sp.]|nr:flavodoxin family protein [Mogibacterium sp.]
MIVVYASNTGHTKQYAEMLAKELNVSAVPVDKIPGFYRGSDAIFFGWLMAENIMGYKKAKAACNVRCVVGVGMSPEDDEIEQRLREKGKFPPAMPVFYLQGGYDFNKLKGPFKAIMSLKQKEILGRFEGQSEAEKQANPVYRMVTEGYSVVSRERLDKVVAWAKSQR